MIRRVTSSTEVRGVASPTSTIQADPTSLNAIYLAFRVGLTGLTLGAIGAADWALWGWAAVMTTRITDLASTFISKTDIRCALLVRLATPAPARCDIAHRLCASGYTIGVCFASHAAEPLIDTPITVIVLLVADLFDEHFGLTAQCAIYAAFASG